MRIAEDVSSLQSLILSMTTVLFLNNISIPNHILNEFLSNCGLGTTVRNAYCQPIFHLLYAGDFFFNAIFFLLQKNSSHTIQFFVFVGISDDH